MKEDEILTGLEKIVESMQVQLRYEKGEFTGGFCVLRDHPMMFISNSLNLSQKIRVLAQELARMNLDNVFIVPALRQVIDEAAAGRGPRVQTGNKTVATQLIAGKRLH